VQAKTQEIKIYKKEINHYFIAILQSPTSPQFSSCAYYAREPLCVSDTGFYGPDVLPVTQSTASKHYVQTNMNTHTPLVEGPALQLPSERSFCCFPVPHHRAEAHLA